MHTADPRDGRLVVSKPADEKILIAEYAAGVLDAEGVRKLESTLRTDADFRRDFIEHLNLDSAISELAALSDAEFASMSSEQAAIRENVIVVQKSALPNIGVMAAVAAVVFLVVGILWLKTTTAPEDSLTAVTVEVISMDDARLVGVDRDVQVGDRLKSNRIRLEKGAIQVGLESGVILDLFGPLEGTLESSMRLQLAHGRLNADVGEAGKGFTVLTDHGEIIDLGTRFGVDVSDHEASVAVFRGEVKVESRGNTELVRSVKVLEGEGVRLRNGRHPRRLSAVWLAQADFGLSANAASSVVVDVTDNVQTDGFNRFYGIIAGGMRDGMVAYTTHASTPRPDVVWQAAEGETFPAELLGADVVCPFHIDRQEQSLTISLQIAGSANVYIMHDLRRKPSAWLKNGFQKTQFTLRSGPWRPVSPLARGIKPNHDGDIYVQYSVWKKRVDAAEKVELGPPQTDGDLGNKAMYGIAVQAIPGQ